MTPHTMDARWPAGVRVLLKVVGTLLALYLVNEVWIERDAEQSQTTLLERKLNISQDKLASHDAWAMQLQEERTLLSSLTQRLPSKLISPAAIETALRDQAARAGIKIASMRLDRAETVREGFYTDRSVDVVVEGSATDFATFTAGLLRDSPLKRVTALQIEPADSAGTVRASMTAHYFRYVDEND